MWHSSAQPAWRIGTLKYLEIKIEEGPSRAKWGQMGPNGADEITEYLVILEDVNDHHLNNM